MLLPIVLPTPLIAQVLPTYEATASYHPGITAATQSAAIGDFDGDGCSDIVVGHYATNSRAIGSMRLFRNNCGAQFQHGTWISSGIPTVNGEEGPWDLVSADMNGDQLKDLIGISTSGKLFVIRSLGNGSFAPAVITETTVSGALFRLALANLNGDATPDLVVGDFGSPVLVFRGLSAPNETGYFELLTQIPNGSNQVVTANFNGTGVDEIAFLVGSEIKVATFSSPTTYFLQTFVLPNAGSRLDSVEFNGDARRDLVVLASTSQGNSFSLLNTSNQSVNFSIQSIGAQDLPSASYLPAARQYLDLDGDQIDEYVSSPWFSTGDSRLLVGTTIPTGGFGAGTYVPMCPGLQEIGSCEENNFHVIPYVGDLNGDQCPDLVGIAIEDDLYDHRLMIAPRTDCPRQAILTATSNPPSGYVYPKQDKNVDQQNERMTSLKITFNEEVRNAANDGVLTPANFSLTFYRNGVAVPGNQADLATGVAPTVQSVTAIDPHTVSLTLAPGLPLGAWTKIEVVGVESLSGTPLSTDADEFIFAHVPVDVDGNGVVSGGDINAWLAYKNGVRPSYPLSINAYCDQTNNNVLAGEDITRFQQLLNGINTSRPQGWIGFNVGPKPPLD